MPHFLNSPILYNCLLLGKVSPVFETRDSLTKAEMEICNKLAELGRDYAYLRTFANKPFDLDSSLLQEAIAYCLSKSFLLDYIEFVKGLDLPISDANVTPIDFYILSRKWAYWLSTIKSLIEECERKIDCPGDLIDIVYRYYDKSVDNELQNEMNITMGNACLKVLVRQIKCWMCSTFNSIDPKLEFFIDQHESCLRMSCLPTILTTPTARLVLFIGKLRRHENKGHKETQQMFDRLLADESRAITDWELTQTIVQVYDHQSNELYELLVKDNQTKKKIESIVFKENSLPVETQIRIQFKWPVSMLFRANSVASYGLYICEEFDSINLLIRRLYGIERKLGDCWYVLKCHQRQTRTSCRNLFYVRSIMSHFVRNLIYYIHVDVIEHEFHRFLNDHQSNDQSSKLDQLTDAFSTLIRNINSQCFVTDDQHIISSLKDCLHIIHEFCEALPGMAKNELMYQRSIDAIKSKFQKSSQLMFNVMLKLKQDGRDFGIGRTDASTALGQYLTRLDYNGFFSKNMND
ncbi:hypothetical protein ACOME3_002250 [Neoechinorhynchus agilis]